jgi:hypothetical protein
MIDTSNIALGVGTSNGFSPAEDLLDGVPAIAKHINKSERATYYMCERKLLPAFKWLNRWHMRRSTFAAYLVKLETAQTE